MGQNSKEQTFGCYTRKFIISRDRYTGIQLHLFWHEMLRIDTIAYTVRTGPKTSEGTCLNGQTFRSKKKETVLITERLRTRVKVASDDELVPPGLVLPQIKNFKSGFLVTNSD